MVLQPGSRTTDDGVIGFIGAYEIQSQALREELGVTVRYGPVEALGQALARTGEITTLTLQVLWKLVTGEAALRNISGPITIAHYAGQSASIGPGHFLNFLALISINLAIINMLPIPVLDGGHMVVLAIEGIIRKPVPVRFLEYAMITGFVLLLALILFVTSNDIRILFGI